MFARSALLRLEVLISHMGMTMKHLAFLLLCIGWAAFASGCGGDKDKGINSNRDKPKAAKMRIEEVNRRA